MWMSELPALLPAYRERGNSRPIALMTLCTRLEVDRENSCIGEMKAQEVAGGREVFERGGFPGCGVTQHVAGDGNGVIAREAADAAAGLVEKLDADLAAGRVGVDGDRVAAAQLDRLERH